MTTPIDFDKIAAQIHQFYCDLAKKPPRFANVFPQPYVELPEFMREDNRAAARRIGLVLKNAGLRLAPRNGVPWTKDDRDRIQAIMEANLEVLAEAEHDGWMETRLRQGWRRVEKKPQGLKAKTINAQRRDQHLLVPYTELAESEKSKDRDGVRNFVTIIAQTDYRIEVPPRD